MEVLGAFMEDVGASMEAVEASTEVLEASVSSMEASTASMETSTSMEASRKLLVEASVEMPSGSLHGSFRGTGFTYIGFRGLPSMIIYLYNLQTVCGSFYCFHGSFHCSHCFRGRFH